jgi:hypothetical protein
MQTDDMENLLYMFLLVHPASCAEKIFSYWNKNNTLREYPRPAKNELTKIVTTLKSEIRIMIMPV